MSIEFDCKTYNELLKENKELQQKISKLEQQTTSHTKTVKISGWKGESGIEVKIVDDRYRIVKYRKSKATSEVSKRVSYIPVENVKIMWQLIRKQLPILPNPLNKNPRYVMKYIDSFNAIKKKYGFPITRNNFNGGQNRGKYYFPFYYYPVKVLEHYDAIKYYGHGSIQRLASKWSP